MRERGLAPSRARGQNFLRSPETARRLIACVGLTHEHAVIEIGPGLGALTRVIVPLARRTVAIEVDSGLVAELRQESWPESLKILHQDALQADLGGISRDLEEPVLLIGNLPYSIAGRLLGALLGPRCPFLRMGLMVQAEVADRVLAEPDSPDYGPLAVWARLWMRTERAAELGPGDFEPRPKVRSTFLVLEPRTDAPLIEDPAGLRALVRAAFQHRRKTLRRGLRDQFPGADAALETAGIDGRRRAETLSEHEFAALARALPAGARVR